MVNFLANLAFWIAYPFIWLFHPKLFKIRMQALKENEFFKGAVQIVLLTVGSTYAVIAVFLVFNLAVHVIPAAGYKAKNEIMSDNTGIREEEQALLDTTANEVVPVAAETDYGDALEEPTEAEDAQARIEALKKKMKIKDPD